MAKKVGKEKMKEKLKRGLQGRVNGILNLTTVGDLFSSSCNPWVCTINVFKPIFKKHTLLYDYWKFMCNKRNSYVLASRAKWIAKLIFPVNLRHRWWPIIFLLYI